MPDGHDPASLLQSAGPAALRQALTNPPTLARTLIDARVEQFADRMQHAEGPFLAVRAAAEAIGALPPEHWLEHIDYLNSIVPTSPGESHLAVLDAGHAWTADPDGLTRKHLAERNLLTRPRPPPRSRLLKPAGRPRRSRSRWLRPSAQRTPPRDRPRRRRNRSPARPHRCPGATSTRWSSGPPMRGSTSAAASTRSWWPAQTGPSGTPMLDRETFFAQPA